VADTESGGITQHILDIHSHEAFSNTRARGANMTDWSTPTMTMTAHISDVSC
jgi:translation initiation factor IF-2